MARGLGSSSACIIAGLLGANRMLGDVLNTQELLTLATAIEGHPDNVAPALLGGLTSSVFSAGLAAQRLNWLKDCKMVMAIPVSASSKNPFFDRKPKQETNS